MDSPRGTMITAIILADDDIEALGATLASLVPAVARGVLRDAVVVDGSSGKDVAVIADAAGTAYQQIGGGGDPWRLGAELGRGNWFLLLKNFLATFRTRPGSRRLSVSCWLRARPAPASCGPLC